MTVRRTWRRLAVALAFGGLAGAAAAAMHDSPADPPASMAAGFVQGRCRLLDHHLRQLDGEARRLAVEELAPIFDRMDGRIDAFAEWAFRWRTAYAMLRRTVIGGLSAMAQGDSVPGRVRGERDGLVEDAFRTIVVVGEDEAMAAAALRWRARLRLATAEVERDHETAVAMYLGFVPGLGGGPQPFNALPPQPSASDAEGGARDLATTRMTRPLLVRVGTRLGALALPVTLVPDALETGALLPTWPASIAALLGFDFVVSRIDAWVSQEAFAAEMRAALADVRTATSDSWAAVGRDEIRRAVQRHREVLTAMSGGACPTEAWNHPDGSDSSN